MTLTRKIHFTPGYDKRPKSPGDINYGIHGGHFEFIVSGPRGVIDFSLNTNWFPTSVEEEWNSILEMTKNRSGAFGWSCVAHSKTPFPPEGEWDTDCNSPSQFKCGWLGDVPCYCKGTGYEFPRKLFTLLCNEGDEALWLALEKHYHEVYDSLHEHYEI